jgi:hypothetical protein
MIRLACSTGIKDALEKLATQIRCTLRNGARVGQWLRAPPRTTYFVAQPPSNLRHHVALRASFWFH